MPLNDDIVAARGDRQAPKLSALDAELDGMLEEENAPPKPVGPAVPSALQPKSSPGFAGEAVRAVAGGVRDAAQNTLDLIDDSATWLNNNLIDLRIGGGHFGETNANAARTGEFINLPKVAENQTVGGKIGRSLTQFVVPFIGTAKLLKGAGMANTAVRGLTAGAITDAAAFDPHEKRLSNMIMEMSDNDPAFGKAAFEYLAANPADSNAEGRFKNALEGAGLGIALEGVFKGLRMVKANYVAKGADPADAVRKAAEAATKEADELAKKAEADKANVELDATLKAKADAKVMPLVDQINALTGVKKAGPDYQKRLDVIAAARTTPRVSLKPLPTPFTKTNTKEVEPLVAQFQAAQKAATDGTAHRVLVDADGGITFTKDAPTSAGVDLGTRVKLIMEQAAATRSASDMVALRAYKQLQESAFPGLAKAGDDAPKATNGAPLATNADDLAAAIKAKDLEIAKMVGKKQNSGLTDPSTLAQMAAAPAGGAGAGAFGAENDDDIATILSLAGVGALAAYGIKVKVGKSKVLTAAEREVVKNADPVVKSLARPEVAGIAPKAFEVPAKRGPVIKGAKVAEMVKLATTGDYKAVSQALKDSDFNFNNIDTPEDIKQLVDGFSSVFEKEHNVAKHGVQTFDQSKELAEELGAGS